MAKEQAFDVFSGNDIVLKISVTDEDNNGAALSLVGAQELIWSLAKKAGATAILTKTLSNGVTITDAANGLVDVVISAADLEPLKGEYYHEMRLTNSQGKKSTLMYGIATIAENLIRS